MNRMWERVVVVMGTALLLASLGGLAGCGGTGQPLTSTTTTLTPPNNYQPGDTVTASDNWSFEGGDVTFTATVRPTDGDGTPTGTVTFKEGATTLGYAPLSSWQATFTTSGLSVGSHSFSAIYSGDANFAPSISDVLPWMVYQYSTTTSRWTWQTFPRESDDLWGVWGTSSSDVFAVGEDGTIIHYNGSDWSAQPSGAGDILASVWGSSSSDVFAVGRYGTILHYDGSVWSTMPSGTTNFLLGVRGTSASDVFAVGGSGTILHYNGNTWSTMTSGTTKELCSVWGSSPSDVFAVGGNATVLHYNGSTWSQMSYSPPCSPGNLKAIWGNSASDVFAGGGDGIAHYNGSTWRTMGSASSFPAQGIWGSSSSDVLAVGNTNCLVHYDGRHWVTYIYSNTPIKLLGIWGSSSSDVFAVGENGAILHNAG